MPPNFGVVIYIVCEVLSSKNISHDCLVFGCRWVVVKDQVPIRFGCGVRKGTHKPLAVTRTYLVRHGAKLRRVPTVAKHQTVVRV